MKPSYIRQDLLFLDVLNDFFGVANCKCWFTYDTNKLAKYFAVSYVAVPILNTIGLNVKSSKLQLKVCVFLNSHRICNGNILLGKVFYKPFQVALISFFSIFLET